VKLEKTGILTLAVQHQSTLRHCKLHASAEMTPTLDRQCVRL